MLLSEIQQESLFSAKQKTSENWGISEISLKKLWQTPQKKQKHHAFGHSYEYGGGKHPLNYFHSKKITELSLKNLSL